MVCRITAKQVFYVVIAMIGFLLLNGCAIRKKDTQKKGIETTLQELIDSIYKENANVKGIMVHVEYPDKDISWSGASGYSDVKQKTKINEQQPALIASTIKTYVAATILRLMEEGKVSIDSPIEELISSKSKALFEKDGYNLQNIKVKHLLSHTSGIEDYINKDYVFKYLDAVNENKQYRWTRDEQLALTVEVGDPLGKAGTVFNYADANYLLLTEIIESLTKQKFYTAMRELLKYEELGLNSTWFYTLEEYPKNTQALVHQYYGKYGWDSYDIDPSFDLYGGGGIACTTEDLAQFSYHFFNGDIVENTAVKDLVFTSMACEDCNNDNYFLGLSEDSYQGMKAFGHGGFWGTVALYFPELDCSIAVYVLERDEGKLRRDILENVIRKLKN